MHVDDVNNMVPVGWNASVHSDHGIYIMMNGVSKRRRSAPIN